MLPAEKIARVIRRCLLEQCDGYKRRRIAVALSGGVDSCSVLAALVDQGAKPVCLSYTPDTHESTDFKMARQSAENLGLEFHAVPVFMEADRQ